VDKRYIRIGEAAATLKLELLDLMSYGIEGEMPIGVLAYVGITPTARPDSFMVREDGEGNPVAGDTPDWLIMLMPKTLREIAEVGMVQSGRGYRWHDDEWEPVDVTREYGITLNDLVIPVGAVQELTKQHEPPVIQHETPISPEGKETFQKQIAGLALVVHKQAQGGQFGGKSPNKSQIAKAVLATIDLLPKDLHASLNLKGIGDGAIRQNIAKGLQHLGFSDKDLDS
jgi:hypothetical protein